MNVATALTRAVIAIVAAAFVSACVSPAAAPSTSPSTSASSSPTPTPSATASTASPSPTTAPLGATYTSFALGYQMELPGPWRRSDCLSTQQPSGLPAVDSFVRVGEQDERGSDIAFYPFEIVQVSVDANPLRLSADEWIASGKIGSTLGQTSQAATLDGRAAVLVRPTANFALAYVLARADRAFVVAYSNAPNDQSSAPTMERMVRSFHLLTEQERAAAPSYPPPPARSAESVADALAKGFETQDPVLLSTVMAPCMSAFAEQAGGTWVPRTVFMTDLRDAFARGLRVAVVPRPIETDPIGTFVRATWVQPGYSTLRRDLYLRAEGSTWSWHLVLTRQPIR